MPFKLSDVAKRKSGQIIKSLHDNRQRAKKSKWKDSSNNNKNNNNENNNDATTALSALSASNSSCASSSSSRAQLSVVRLPGKDTASSQ